MKVKEKVMEYRIFTSAACVSILAVALICIFLFCKRTAGNERNRCV